MASVDNGTNNPNDPNNPNNVAGNVNQQGGQTNQPATTSGAGGVTATGAGNVTGQVVGTNNPSQPFQNISSYLEANAPQSASLANQVANSVSAPIGKASADITDASKNFGTSVNAGYTPLDTNLTSLVASNPTLAASDPNNVAAFQKQLNDVYTGPGDFTSTPQFANLESEVANAQSLGQSAQTPTGIQSLLKGIEGPTTAGVNNLDALLLNQDPNNAATIAAAGAKANTQNNTLDKLLKQETSTNNAAAQKAIQEAKAAAAGAGSALNTASSNVVQAVQPVYNSALSGTEAYNANLSAIINAISSGNLGNLSPDQQKQIGLNPDIITLLSQYPGIFPSQAASHMPNPSVYYSGPNAATLPSSMAQFETPEQAAAVAALQTLNGGAPLSSLSGLSGTAPETPYKVPNDLGKYNNLGLASFMNNAYDSMYRAYQNLPANTPVAGKSPAEINAFMKLLESIADPSQPQPVPTGGGGGLGGTGWGGV